MENRPKIGRDSGDLSAACDPTAVLKDVYEKHGSHLYRYALMILADHAQAQDAVQQVFMKAVKLGKRILEIASHDSYLRKAVRNECYEILKKRRQSDNAARLLSAQPILQKTPGATIDEDEQKILDSAIRKLPPDQREVLYMKVYEDKTFSQIARITGVSTNTAASRYRYAMDKLKETLTVHGINLSER